MASFSFGSTPKPTTSTSFAGFSTPQQSSTQPQNSLFGGQNTTPQTSLFGGQTSTSTPQQQQPTQGGLFGSTQNQNQNQNQGTTSGRLFGSTTQNAQTGGLFGQTNQPQVQAQSQGTGLGGSLFGSTSNNASGSTMGGTSLFGQPQQQQQQQSSGGLFGQQQPQQQQQQQPGGSLFGASASKPSTGLFGSLGQSTQQPQNQQQQGGLFSFGNASTSQPQQSQQQPQAQQQQQLPSLFASSSAPFGSSSVLGSSQLGQSVAPTSSFGGISVGQKQEPDIESRMMAVQRAWDTNSPDCRFKYFFYNVVDHGTTSQYGRPAGATDDAKWSKAVREIPDPSCMVPVLATGWGDVKKRVQMQENVASVHQQRIKEISQALSHLTRQSSLSSSIRLTALQTHLNQLLHRLIHLAALTPQFIPILQSTSYRPEESQTRQQLEAVKSELEGKGKAATGRIGANAVGTPRSGSAGKGRMIGQVNELWGQLEEIRRTNKGRSVEGKDGWLRDEAALAEVAEILATQQLALQKLTDLLNNALFDAEVMKQGLGAVGGNGRA